jgi:hypothetical protein
MATRIPPLIVCGNAGAGKSHYIENYAKDRDLEVLVCPCRIDRTLREQRTKLHEWAHRLQPSLLWLEGADDLTPEAQSFLRRILETYSPNVNFVLECRTIESIQEPIRSRCVMKQIPMPSMEQLTDFGLSIGLPATTVIETLNVWPPSRRTWRQVQYLKFQINEKLPYKDLNIWNQLEKQFMTMSREQQRDYLHCRHLGGNPLAFLELHKLRFNGN